MRLLITNDDEKNMDNNSNNSKSKTRTPKPTLNNIPVWCVKFGFASVPSEVRNPLSDSL